MRIAIALYAFGLLLYPVWMLISPEFYRAELDEFPQAAGATVPQLQMVAGLHFLKNAYLAFIFLLLARYLGRPERPGDVQRAGVLLMALPLVLLVFGVLAQIAMSPDPEELALTVRVRSEFLLYGILGLSLIGIARLLIKRDRDDSTP